MARLWFGGTTADFVFSTSQLVGRRVISTTPALLTFWTARTGGTRYFDLVLNGSAVTSVTTTADGMIPMFQGPDGIDRVWVQPAGGAPRLQMNAIVEPNAIFAVRDAVAVDRAYVEDLVITDLGASDGQVKTLIDSPSSLTAQALTAIIETEAGALVDDALAVEFGSSGAAAQAPNVLLGGALNGSGFATDVFGSTILNPGHAIAGNNNVIGGDGTLTVGQGILNVPRLSTGAIISLVGGYDNVAGQISSKIISDHSYTEPAPAGETVGGHSAIFGGTSHIIRWTAGHAMIAGGRSLDVGGSYSLTTGYANTNNQKLSVVAGGQNVVGTGEGGAVFGSSHTVADNVDFFHVSGFDHTVNAGADGSRIHGARGVARHPLTDVLAGGRIATDGDAQVVRANYNRQTTSAAPTPLQAIYPSSTSPSQYKLAQGQSALITVRVVARKAGGPSVGMWNITAAAHWETGAGAPVFLGTPTITPVYTDGTGAAPAMTIGAIGMILVMCTGLASTTINWSCSFEAVEVMA